MDEATKAEKAAERKSMIASLYIQGWTTRQIAAKVGISYQAVHAMLQRLNIPLRPRGGNMGSHSRRKK